jgi:NAD-dependent dihydropyrimidine dehydrogenase PreA subunit
MERDIIIIDEELCDGCGDCVSGCHEGALQIISGKARLVSELVCDGLGACVGHCHTGALRVERRDAPAYNEVLALKGMIPKGYDVIDAHLKHLSHFRQHSFVAEGLAYLKSIEADLPFSISPEWEKLAGPAPQLSLASAACAPGGCPGTAAQNFLSPKLAARESESPSQLAQWPIQLHLVHPGMEAFSGADMLLAADCAAYSIADFHGKWLKSKALAIACPKLDTRQETYTQKLAGFINQSRINSLTVIIMEVPCCRGLLSMAQKAVESATRKIPIRKIVAGVRGNIVSDEWVH